MKLTKLNVKPYKYFRPDSINVKVILISVSFTVYLFLRIRKTISQIKKYKFSELKKDKE